MVATLVKCWDGTEGITTEKQIPDVLYSEDAEEKIGVIDLEDGITMGSARELPISRLRKGFIFEVVCTLGDHRGVLRIVERDAFENCNGVWIVPCWYVDPYDLLDGELNMYFESFMERKWRGWDIETAPKMSPGEIS